MISVLPIIKKMPPKQKRTSAVKEAKRLGLSGKKYF